MVVAYITRGIAPVELALDAYRQAEVSGYTFALISGKPLVEAKNEAVDRALDLCTDLLLIGDDVRVPYFVWNAVESLEKNQVFYADTVERYGRINARYNKAGDLMWTGNVFTVIAHDVLARLESPVFRSWNFVFTGDGQQLIDRGSAQHGHHSDAYFWWTAQKLEPKPQIKYIGRVDHMITPFNSGKVTEHSKPFRFKAFADTTNGKTA